MADTPSEGGLGPATSKRSRRPRAAGKDHASAAKPRARRAAKKVEPGPVERMKAGGRAAADEAQSVAAKAKRTTKRAVRTTRAGAGKIAAAKPSRLALGAAAALGVAAGVAAAVIGRRKIAETAGSVADTVSETVVDLVKPAEEKNTQTAEPETGE